MWGAKMSKLIDLTGQNFGRLTVLERASNSQEDKLAGNAYVIVEM